MPRVLGILIILAMTVNGCQCDEMMDVEKNKYTVAGLVTIKGTPAAGLTVTVRDGIAGAHTDRTGATGRYNISFEALTSGGGTITVSGQPAGIAFLDHPRDYFFLETGQWNTFDFAGVDRAGITVRLLWSGVGIPGVDVGLTVVMTGQTRSGVTDANGKVAFRDLDPASYIVIPSNRPDLRWDAPLRTVGLRGTDLVVVFDGEFYGGPLEGRVTADGIGLPGVLVTVAGPWNASRTTDANGEYIIDNLESGDYTVSISGYDAAAYVFPETSKTVTIEDFTRARADFSTVTPANTAPVVSITAPANGVTRGLGVPITFSGVANDAEDGALSGAALVWTSDRDGPIGTGTSFTSNALSLGAHVITLTATDTDGATASAGIAIAIVNNQAPTASITAPSTGSGFYINTAVGFSGSASDPEDGALTGASLVWTSSLEGQIGTGTNFTHSFTVEGDHIITLTATDSHGATGTATVAIFTVDPGPPTPFAIAPDSARESVPYRVTTFSMRTTSNADEGTVFSWPSSASSQRGSGAPLTYQPLPLSATNMPYRFSARRMTCTFDENPLMSYDAASRTRMPIGGSSGLLSDEA